MFAMIDWVIGFVLVVCFFVAVWRLGRISGYLQKLVEFEQIRMQADGLDVKAPVVEAPMENWTCRNGHTNEPKFMVCQTCGASK